MLVDMGIPQERDQARYETDCDVTPVEDSSRRYGADQQVTDNPARVPRSKGKHHQAE